VISTLEQAKSRRLAHSFSTSSQHNGGGGGGTDRKKNRDKFEALINSSTDSDLKGFLQEGIFSLNHLPELLRRLVELGRSAVVVVPAPAPSPAPAPAPAPAPSQADLNEDGHYDVEAALGSHCRIDLLLR
jgi:hypothetical protein